jgi:hypothetical protein
VQLVRALLLLCGLTGALQGPLLLAATLLVRFLHPLAAGQLEGHLLMAAGQRVWGLQPAATLLLLLVPLAAMLGRV